MGLLGKAKGVVAALLLKLLPESLKARLTLFLQARAAKKMFIQDAYRFLRVSGVTSSGGQATCQAWILFRAHAVEKGLALPSPRPGFGQAIVEDLLTQLEDYERAYEPDVIAKMGVETLQQYCHFNRAHNTDVSAIEQRLQKLKANSLECQVSDLAGTLDVNREQIHRRGKIDLTDFFQSRYSIRQFSATPVDMTLIYQAIKLALKTPSVCNRQAWRVHVYSRGPLMEDVLEQQDGNRGFRDVIDKVMVVTGDLRGFLTLRERHQCWVDAGMFAMTIMYALHSLGLGCCPLHMCFAPQAESVFRAVAGLEEYETPVVMLAIGNLPERLSVARSYRKPLESVLVDHVDHQEACH